MVRVEENVFFVDVSMTGSCKPLFTPAHLVSCPEIVESFSMFGDYLGPIRYHFWNTYLTAVFYGNW